MTEVHRCSTSQDILQNPKVYHRVHKSQALDSYFGLLEFHPQIHAHFKSKAVLLHAMDALGGEEV
jgi:hypothetical protein